MNIAVAGCGYWGKNLVRNFSELNALVAVCDHDVALARKFSAEYKVPNKTWDEVLADEGIDGVVIASPAIFHAKMCIEALEAGKHVFVEKPLALSLDDVDLIEKAAKDSKKILMVGHLLRYHPAIKKLSEIIKGGKLGKIHFIRSNRFNFGKIRSEENILWSFAPHDISVILGLANEEPLNITATGKRCFGDKVEDFATVQMSFPSDLRAEICVSWLYPFKEQKLVVVGEKGMAVMDDTLPAEEKLKLYFHDYNRQGKKITHVKKDPTVVSLESLEPLKLECQHFLDCISNNSTPTTNLQEGKRVLEVLSEAQRCLDNSKNALSKNFYVHPTACIDEGAQINEGSKIWHFSHIFGSAKIGKNCNLGQNVMVGPEVIVGNNCKIQNNVSLYKGVKLEDGVFCGPSCVFTNVHNPRSEVERKEEFMQTLVDKGATIGANATIVCGVKLGRYCFVGAGAVVTKDVPDHACVVGNPAKQIGWRSHAGEKLGKDLICPRTKKQYRIKSDGKLERV